MTFCKGMVLLACALPAAAGPAAAKLSSPPATTIEVAFPPEDDATGLLIRAIDQAQRTVRVQAYLFTNRRIGHALIRAHRRGVDVQAIGDQEQFEKNGAPMLSELDKAGAPVYLDGEHAAAHNKIILVDALHALPVVVTGSFNFTVAAQKRNAENLLVIKGNRELAAAYWEHWKLHREHAKRLQ